MHVHEGLLIGKEARGASHGHIAASYPVGRRLGEQVRSRRCMESRPGIALCIYNSMLTGSSRINDDGTIFVDQRGTKRRVCGGRRGRGFFTKPKVGWASGGTSLENNHRSVVGTSDFRGHFGDGLELDLMLFVVKFGVLIATTTRIMLSSIFEPWRRASRLDIILHRIDFHF